jgi:hypothetical protein
MSDTGAEQGAGAIDNIYLTKRDDTRAQVVLDATPGGI